MNKSGIIFFVSISVIAFTLFGIINKSQRQTDIVIKTQTQEFIVDNYHLYDNCIEFNYGGELRTICGNYEIIE